MITRDELTAYLQKFLVCDSFNDYAPNGLQIEGRENIQRFCTAVTASKAVIEKAIAMKADALLVHHGYFWRGEDPVITGMKRARIAGLLSHDINLFAYHLPLDCHLSIGNNACLGQLLGMDNVRQHMAGKTTNLLWSGALSSPLTAKAFSIHITEQLKRAPLHVSGAKEGIQKVAWCSGAAEDFIEDAHRLGVDAYLSGEISERTYYQAEELGMHYFACGHHATERYGVQALGLHLSERYGLKYQYIESDNPV